MASSSPRAKQNTNVRWRGLAQFVSSQEDSIQEDAIALCCEECLAGQELCVAGSCGRIHPLTLAQSPPTVSPCPPARSPPPLPRFPVSLPRVLRMRWEGQFPLGWRKQARVAGFLALYQWMQTCIQDDFLWSIIDHVWQFSVTEDLNFRFWNNAKANVVGFRLCHKAVVNCTEKKNLFPPEMLSKPTRVWGLVMGE